jgi:phenylalanyl-tRNA synthetase alpha chain
MPSSILSKVELERALSIRDLTDPMHGPHAMQVLLDDAVAALHGAWQCALVPRRAHPVVAIADNYDRLHYPPGGAARDARYTRYVSETHLLRSQTSAMIPGALAALDLAASPDILVVCPGIVYRRDTIDRLHTGEPHQVDLWRIRRGEPLGREDLLAMIRLVVAAVLPGRAHRVIEAAHPYTVGGLQIDVEAAGEWVEIGECGLALPALLGESGHDPASTSGLAMGLGLDRLVMLRKGIDDIRLLRSADPRIATQMLDLSPYRPVSMQPPIRRDLSIATDAGDTPEELGDRVRAALGARASSLEGVEVVSETAYEALPGEAVARLGMGAEQKNVLLRLTIRDLERTLTHAEANVLRDEVYAALHRGSVWHWASRRPAA